MLRVRPGVLLVRASFLPTSVLMTLDLPTFERPRKAISGSPGRGKCATSLADKRYCDKIRMETVSSVWMAIGKSSEEEIGEMPSLARLEGSWSEAERPLVFDVDVLDRMQPVPERESARDDKSDENADDEEQPISRESDEEDGHDGDGHDESGGALQAETETGPGHIEIILALM